MEEKKLFWLRVTGVCSALILACMLAITVSLLARLEYVSPVSGRLSDRFLTAIARCSPPHPMARRAAAISPARQVVTA